MRDFILSDCIYQASENLLKFFKARRINNARISWLNKTYFLKEGYDVGCQETLDRIRCDIINKFAVSSIELPNMGVGDVVWLGADRYGGSDGTYYGGSGRCGIQGHFNAKGIGPTPLITPGAPWSYSHGFLYMYDALRETVASEIAGAELPNGSVPVVAIIDTGFSIAPRENDEYHRCAIIVRPNFFRASHLERSVFYGTSGFKGSDQHIDALRVRDVNRYLHGRPLSRDGVAFSTDTYLNAAARQVAAVRAHRIWNGRPVSGNLTIDGRYFDYGAFRALPHWGKADDGHGQVFGDDAEDLAKSQASLDFYCSKYAGVPLDRKTRQHMLQTTLASIDITFSEICVRSCGLDPARLDHQTLDDLRGEFVNYYYRQQRHRYSLDDEPQSWTSAGWLLDDLTNDDAPSGSHMLATVLRHALCKSESHARPEALRLVAARRWLSPRTSQYYNVFTHRARQAVKAYLAAAPETYPQFDDFVNSEVSRSRRVWKGLPNGFVLAGYARDVTVDVFFVFDPDVGKFDILYQGHLRDGCALINGRWLNPDIVERCSVGVLNQAEDTYLLSYQAMLAVFPSVGRGQSLRPVQIFEDAWQALQAQEGRLPWTA